jgi:adenylate kinase family enzyme
VDRVAIIGCGGSGKSHLARQLGSRLAAPVTHLDVVYYDSEWNTLPPEEFALIQKSLVTQPRWIIDGNYASTLQIRLAAADTVIFLDFPAHTCLWGIIQRRLRQGGFRGGQHDAIGVYDRITWNFLRYITSYRRKMRPRVLRLCEQHAAHADVVVLRSRHAVRRYLATAPATTMPYHPPAPG